MCRNKKIQIKTLSYFIKIPVSLIKHGLTVDFCICPSNDKTILCLMKLSGIIRREDKGIADGKRKKYCNGLGTYRHIQ